MENIVEIVISLAALVISLISLHKSSKNDLLAQGEIEFQIATLIRDAQFRVGDLALEIGKCEQRIRSGLNNIDDDEEFENVSERDYEFKSLMATMGQAEEMMLNAYEESCAKYLDKKVDQERFRRSYNRSIRELVESDNLDEQFNSNTTPYKCILKVYNQWHNLEV